MSPPKLWKYRLLALALLAIYVGLAALSMLDKGNTYDEISHLTAGVSHLRTGDYRLNSEQGALPQRWAALPVSLGPYQFPPLAQPAWQHSNEWVLGQQFFFELGNNLNHMLWQARWMMVVVGAFLGLVTYLWSKSLFGPRGALLSLSLYVFSPAILAHTTLVTSDATLALTFTLAVGLLWLALHRLSLLTLAAVSVAVALLFLSKASAWLFVPIALVLITLRLAMGKPLRWGAFKSRRLAKSRSSASLAALTIALAMALSAYTAIWAAFDFRFSPFASTSDLVNDSRAPGSNTPESNVPESDAPESNAPANSESTSAPAASQDVGASAAVSAPSPSTQANADDSSPSLSTAWPDLLKDQTSSQKLLSYLRDHRLLPEAYLWGLAYAWQTGQERPAFLNGQYSMVGWAGFFPYAFLVKTPLGVFALLALGIAAGLQRWEKTRGIGRGNIGGKKAFSKRWLYRTLPLWVFLGIYWLAAIRTPLNIGHRHILAVYPAVFILAGAAGYYLRPGRRSMRLLVFGSVAIVAAETIAISPDYLAYFNVLAGGPRNAYRHLVDSSLDWGQDLPRLAKYLQDRRLIPPPSADDTEPAKPAWREEVPVYLAYFGTGDPWYYGITAHRLPGYPDMFLRPDFPEPLQPGVYCLSATVLQSVYSPAMGPWCRTYEEAYARYRGLWLNFLRAQNDPQLRADLDQRFAPQDWIVICQRYEQLRMARLCAWLRQNRAQPDDQVGYSIHIYLLNASDLAAALNDPTPPQPYFDKPQVRGLDVE
ncbi:MAG: glycosyltransferase family 39 protein [Phycisphaeraceae bacterium]|nr:glycosyltransferase family 39 protein [Phycisphaeraceae bacterium]